MHDVIHIGFCPQTRLRVIAVDVTESARALEVRHLAGPTAGAVLAEGLAAVALLTADVSQADETVYIRLKVDGPVKGLLAEASGNGDLRGFPNIKVLNDLDGAEAIDPHVALGTSGHAQVVRSVPGRVLNQAMVTVTPPRLDKVVARYCNQSLQVPTAVAVAVRADVAGVLYARALLVERMPDTESQAFVDVLEAFQDGRVDRALAETEQLDAFRDIFRTPDLSERSSRPLQFHCRCSRERILNVVRTLPGTELDEMVGEDRTQQITCHMCGQAYPLSPEDLRALKAERQ
ncbi:MAG: Hsp33 family molecular chaperone HslO [Lentisphaerae bacterium]|nr:Hsp33 family molecular chaperone HslO [Lentisphaerota bacterium]